MNHIGNEPVDALIVLAKILQCCTRIHPYRCTANDKTHRKLISKYIETIAYKKLCTETHVIKIFLKNSADYLDEAYFLSIAAKALSATHEPILSNYTMGVPTNTAAKLKYLKCQQLCLTPMRKREGKIKNSYWLLHKMARKF